MAIIGDQFDVGQEICGAVLSIRNSEDILSVWNQSAHEGRTNLKIRYSIVHVWLSLSNGCNVTSDELIPPPFF
jgi:translation initiation factor 4E